MDQQMKNDCQCDNAGCGCAEVRATGCACGERCGCSQACRCDGGCDCPAEKPGRHAK